MKYICLFENFEEGHKFDILDLFTISPNEVENLFFRELEKRNSDLENIQVFLDSELVNVNATDDMGFTPLHWAADLNHLELAKLLISSGADLEAKDNVGFTPLHLAAIHNSLAVAKLLISSGADLEAKGYKDWTPLHVADSQEMRELIISHGGVR